MKREAESGGTQLPTDPQYGEEVHNSRVSGGPNGDDGEEESSMLTMLAIGFVFVLVAAGAAIVYFKSKKDTRKFDF